MNYGSVSTVLNYAGGICANNQGKIIKCGNYGRIISMTYSGGICSISSGKENEDVIFCCFNKGNVEADTFVGGICGGTNDDKLQINSVYNIGNIIANSSSESNGGILGENTYSAIIKNSYNLGNVYYDLANQIAPKSSSVYNSYYLSGKTNISGNGIEKEESLFKADKSNLNSVLYLLDKENENIWTIQNENIIFVWE